MESDKERIEDIQDQDQPDQANNAAESPGPNEEPSEGEDELAAALIEAHARCDQLEQDLLRSRAEMDNFRKRSYREIENARKFALERFMTDLLDVVDSLDRGLDVAVGEQITIELLREGSELTQRQLKNALAKHGLTEINPTDGNFDPELHEAISMVSVEGKAANCIVDVVQKGYLLNDRLLRPARVVVAE